ncbi:LANO_0F15566g1_1 [Lachancea nothofagi CBS 11611]|uniref:Protein YAE1 n=1 Tax=Lachancea nothofagi CBS 11611 TaxID=1266666 RepID=A0A1G4KCL0_9SACH|nr:LANO_0F15566g1_1 [Lachancea nothofagi CBS 11611]
MSISDGDIWESDSEEGPCASERGESVEIRKLQSIHNKRGYLDGITSAKEENLQQGFDHSYHIGANIGSRIGVVLGGLQILAFLHGDNNETLKKDLAQAQQDLRINKVLSKENFDNNCTMVKTENPVSYWEETLAQHQKEYIKTGIEEP